MGFAPNVVAGQVYHRRARHYMRDRGAAPAMFSNFMTALARWACCGGGLHDEKSSLTCILYARMIPTDDPFPVVWDRDNQTEIGEFLR
jgi:hypothetical protein